MNDGFGIFLGACAGFVLAILLFAFVLPGNQVPGETVKRAIAECEVQHINQGPVARFYIDVRCTDEKTIRLNYYKGGR